MSQENVEIVRRIYEAWNSSPSSRSNQHAVTRADILGLELFDPTFELHQLATSPDSAIVFRGHDALLHAVKELLGGLRDLSWKPDNFLDAPDDRVVVPFRFGAIGRSTGIPLEMPLVHVWTLRDELAIRCDTYPDLAEALEDVGLSEQDAQADS